VWLLEKEQAVNRKRVQRLMRLMGLEVRRPAKLGASFSEPSSGIGMGAYR
jgi:hypothetical protein